MRVKTSELTGAALDWAVAKCECGDDIVEIDDPHFYSTDWAQGGPIIERECIALEKDPRYSDAIWVAEIPFNGQYSGPTPLIAAMRCYVASKLGDEVDVPNKLVETKLEG